MYTKTLLIIVASFALSGCASNQAQPPQYKNKPQQETNTFAYEGLITKEVAKALYLPSTNKPDSGPKNEILETGFNFFYKNNGTKYEQ